MLQTRSSLQTLIHPVLFHPKLPLTYTNSPRRKSVRHQLQAALERAESIMGELEGSSSNHREALGCKAKEVFWCHIRGMRDIGNQLL
jgi:hypothetical protein